jgi:hypothetical protein
MKLLQGIQIKLSFISMLNSNVYRNYYGYAVGVYWLKFTRTTSAEQWLVDIPTALCVCLVILAMLVEVMYITL